VAALAVILASLIYALHGVFGVLSRGHGRWVQAHNVLLNLAPGQTIAPAVVVAWMVMILNVGWRPNAGGIDRLGRFLGFIWLGLLLYVFVGDLLFITGVRW
jgi:hypothetical protein